MNNINLVTGYWNGRSDRSDTMYLQNFKNVLELNHNMTIFIPKEFKNFVLEHRNDKLDKTDIIIVELEDIKNKYFSKYYDKVESIRTTPEWYNSLQWLSGVPQGFSQWYNPIVMSKVIFMHESYKINKFNSDTYIWIDAGITQHVKKELVCDKSVQNMSNHIKYVLFQSYDYISNEIHGFDYNGFEKYTDIIPKWNCRATIFGCDKNYMDSFKDVYEYFLNDTLERGYLGTEESIFSLLSCVDSTKYNRYHTPNNGMPDMFLQNMKNE